MDQREFLEDLYNALQGEMPDMDVQSQISYYRDYFSAEESNGKNEREILDQLGSPRLIARTIIDSYKMEQTPWNRKRNDEEARNFDEDQDFTEQDGRQRYDANRRMFPWYYKLFGVLFLIIVFVLVIAIGGLAIRIFLSVGLPLLIGILLVRFIWSALKK